ncbi:MAG: AMP-binding protein [Paracoccaceae bacterium]
MHNHFDAFNSVEANHVALSPVSFLNRAGNVYADATAVVYGEIRRNWAETLARTRALAGGLNAVGISLGDTICVLSPNLPELFELHFAVPMSGGVLCALNTRLETETIAYILDHSETKLIIVDTALRPVMDEALGLLAAAHPDKPALPIIEVIDPMGPAPEGSGCPTYEDLLTGPMILNSGVPEDEWQAITLNYTSGTSGRPKGVVYHHRGAYLMALGTVAAWQVPARPSYLSVVPMFHCNGWGHPWMMAITGGKMVFTRTPAPEALFPVIKAEDVTHLGAAPIILQMLAESDAAPTKPFDPPIQVMTAGAPPPPAILERTAAMGMDVMHVYGLTETFGHISQALPQPGWADLPMEEQSQRRARQGVSFPMVEGVEVIDRTTGRPVRRDGETQGEIAIRGNTVMKGYYKNADATSEAFQDGWFWSGDAAVVYPDGYMQIRDRLKDVIISGGENVSSVEVEAVLYRHPDIQSAAVVARPDPKWGEVPCAFVELRTGTSADEAQIITFCRERLAGFKTPKSVIFTEIPKTSTGKVQKFELRNRVRTME